MGNRYRHGCIFLRRLIGCLNTRVIILARNGDRHCRGVTQSFWVTHFVAERVDPVEVGAWSVIHRVVRSSFHRSMHWWTDAIARKVSKRVVRIGDCK